MSKQFDSMATPNLSGNLVANVVAGSHIPLPSLVGLVKA